LPNLERACLLLKCLGHFVIVGNLLTQITDEVPYSN